MASSRDANAGNYLWIDVDPLDQVPPDDVALIRGVGDNGALTDDGILTFHNAGFDPDSGDPDVVASNGGAGEGIVFEAITFAAPAPDIDFGYAIGRRPVAEQEDPPIDLGYTPPVTGVGYVPNVLFRFEAATGAAISATGAEREEAERIPVPNPGPTPPPAFPVEQPNAGTQLVESGVLAVTYPNPDTGADEFGGDITGLAFVGGSLLGITNLGHLFSIAGQDGPGASARYVATITDEDGEGVEFQGLTAGPKNVEDGRFANVLFGIDGGGDLYAFDTQGEPQPIFVDGQTFVSTGTRGAVGLEFATVDMNLWHVTTERGGDPGHTPANSFYFGEDVNGLLPGHAGEPRYYDLLGGSQGSLVTNPFSLEGYAGTDVPSLYFNYLLITEETDGRDAFRVYVSDNGREDTRGQWELLASNQAADQGLGAAPLFDNTWRDIPFWIDPEDPLAWQRNGDRDPFPYPDDDGSRPFDPAPGNWDPYAQSLNETLPVWRQAKLDLSAYAGSRDIRLRFDFSTAASFDMGGASTTGGSQLLALAGARLRDGDLFTIDEQVFEFDMGYTVVAVTGQMIPDGETIAVDGMVFEFTRGDASPGNVPVPITDDFSALEVADSLFAALTGAGMPIAIPHQNGERIDLEAAAAVTQSPNAAIILEGAPGVAPENLPVVVHSEMSATEVAESMRQPLADAFAGGVVEVIKGYENAVYVIGHDVADPGPLGYVANLPGDENGTFNARDRFLANTQVDYDLRRRRVRLHGVPGRGLRR